MARKGKNRPKKLPSSSAHSPDDFEPAKTRGHSSIVFEVEPNADQMILESLEKFDRQGLRQEDKDDREAKALIENRAKTQARQDSQAIRRTVDLHRLTVEEAKAAVDRELQSLIASLRAGEKAKVRIVTGKGRHSGKGGAVLPREIHQHVRRMFARSIASMDDSPADLVVGELPLRGHFDVVLIGRQ